MEGKNKKRRKEKKNVGGEMRVERFALLMRLSSKLRHGTSTLLILHYNFTEAPGPPRFLALIAVILSYVQGVVTAFTSVFPLNYTSRPRQAPSESR